MRIQRVEDRSGQHRRNFKGWREFNGAPAIIPYTLCGMMWTLPDRCFIHATPDWTKWLRAASSSGEVYRCLQPSSLSIKRHRPFYPFDVVDTAKEGWQGIRVRAVIQIILHILKDWPPLLEIDFDMINKASGLFGLIGHGIEWAWLRTPCALGRPKRQTSPYRIAGLLVDVGMPVEIEYAS